MCIDKTAFSETGAGGTESYAGPRDQVTLRHDISSAFIFTKTHCALNPAIQKQYFSVFCHSDTVSHFKAASIAQRGRFTSSTVTVEVVSQALDASLLVIDQF